MWDLFQTSKLAMKIDQKVLDDMVIEAETGEPENAYFERIAIEKQEQFEANTETLLENQRINRREIEEASIRASERIRESQEENIRGKEEASIRESKRFKEERLKRESRERDILRETIKFWEEKRERDEQSARDETIWLAEYWLNYAKQKDKMAQEWLKAMKLGESNLLR